MSFFNNPESNAIQAFFIMVILVGIGGFAYLGMHNNAGIEGTAKVINTSPQTIINGHLNDQQMARCPSYSDYGGGVCGCIDDGNDTAHPGCLDGDDNCNYNNLSCYASIAPGSLGGTKNMVPNTPMNAMQ